MVFKKGFKGFLLCFEEVTLNSFHLNQFQGFSCKTLLGIGPTRIPTPTRLLLVMTNESMLTLYGHIKTAEQPTIQQYGDWYTGR